MVTALAGAAGLTGAGTGAVGFLIGIGAGVVDAYVLMPALAGKGRQAALPPRLQGVPVGSNEAGAPRIWAIGGRVRVPTHILWQKDKVRESTTSHYKQGTDVLQREVMVDCLVALNDRKTVELTQLIGNGKLLIWESRNLQRITTHEMSAAVSGADVVITMANTLVPSPTDVFKVNDFVRLYGWVSTAGPAINGFYWRVKAIVAHTSTPGTITLQVVDGQSVASVSANAGNAFTPAHIERVDDAVVYDPTTVTVQNPVSSTFGLAFITGAAGSRDPRDVFNVGDRVKLVYASSGAASNVYRIVSLTGSEMGLLGPNLQAITPLAGGNRWLRVEYASLLTSAASFFAPGYVPKDHFHDGDENQGEDPTLVAEKGTGNVPAYRGLCYQAIDREA